VFTLSPVVLTALRVTKTVSSPSEVHFVAGVIWKDGMPPSRRRHEEIGEHNLLPELRKWEALLARVISNQRGFRRRLS
jgi:hypothetical protein